MKNVTKNFDARRKTFDNGLQFYTGKGIVPQRAQLRAMAELRAGSDKLKFLFTKDQSLQLKAEMLLNNSDLFVGTALGLALVIEKAGYEGMAPLYSYPVPAGDYLHAHLEGFENGNAFAVYNGKLGMKTGSTVNYSRLPLIESLYIPETQPVGVVNADGDAIIPAGIVPAFNIENVLIQLEERLVLAGTKNQPFELEFPLKAGEGFGVPAGTKAYAVLIIDGYIYESGATEEMKAQGNPYKDMI